MNCDDLEQQRMNIQRIILELYNNKAYTDYDRLLRGINMNNQIYKLEKLNKEYYSKCISKAKAFS